MRLYQKHTGDIKKRARILRKEGGFTLIDVLFAIAILTFGLLAVAKMQGSAIQGNFFASGKTDAITWAQDRMERLLALPYASVASSTTPITQGNYDISWVVNAGAVANTKSIKVTVTPRIKGVGQKDVELTCVKPQM